MSTDLTDLNNEPEPIEPIAPVTSDPNDLQAEPETEEPVAPVPLTPPISLFTFTWASNTFEYRPW